MLCPICSVEPTTPHRLRTHLMGKTENGGHEQSPEQAEELVLRASAVEKNPPPSTPAFGSPPTLAVEVPDAAIAADSATTRYWRRAINCSAWHQKAR